MEKNKKQDHTADTPAEAVQRKPSVIQEFSKVATNPKQSILILVVLIGILGYVLFNVFMSLDSKKEKTENQQVQAPIPDQVLKTQKITQSNRGIPEIPRLPQVSKFKNKLLLPDKVSVKDQDKDVKADSNSASKSNVPNTQSSVNNLPIVTPTDNNLLNFPGIGDSDDIEPILPTHEMNQALQERKEKKWKAPIMLISGTPPKKTPEQIAQDKAFHKRGNMDMVLGQGKIIEAVIETAINSDFGGTVRAVISRDVYSGGGKVILIPKGSRVFGNYSKGFMIYGRIPIIWNKIDMPNGYTLTFAGTDIDNLGRPGTEGRVDNKWKERMSNTILMSAVNISVANALDKIVAPPINSEVAAKNSAASTSMRDIAFAIFKDPAKSNDQKIQEICANVQNLISDKTSDAYTTFSAACFALNTKADATAAEKLSSLITSVNSAADSLLQNNDQNINSTKAQDASKEAFTNITDTLKNMLEQQEFNPTVTINQGSVIKIYVNKDYTFPKDAIHNRRLIQ